MRHFDYKNGELYAENIPVREIAEKFGTPTYIYSHSTLVHHYKVLENALKGIDFAIAFAVKSNSNRAVLNTLGKLGAGADTVSEGEIRRALNAGIAPQKIVFSGVGKTKQELEFAVKTRIKQINIESAAELYMLNEVCNSLKLSQKIVFRVNPDVAAGAHDKISTGKATSKFGIGVNKIYALYEEASKFEFIEPVGLAVHVGSQIIDIEPLRAGYEVLASMTHELRSRGLKVSRLDFGGGLGAIYEEGNIGPDVNAYGKMVKEIITPLGVELEIEPGRMICANAGILISKVIVNKENGGREIAVMDAAMNDLIRPALYEAYHQLLPIEEAIEGTNMMPTTVVGPICESGDTFTTDRPLPKMDTDDLIAFMSAGAYGFSMASNYNSRPLAAEIMVNGDKMALIRPRQTYEEIFGKEIVPDWE